MLLSVERGLIQSLYGDEWWYKNHISYTEGDVIVYHAHRDQRIDIHALEYLLKAKTNHQPPLPIFATGIALDWNMQADVSITQLSNMSGCLPVIYRIQFYRYLGKVYLLHEFRVVRVNDPTIPFPKNISHISSDINQNPCALLFLIREVKKDERDSYRTLLEETEHKDMKFNFFDVQDGSKRVLVQHYELRVHTTTTWYIAQHVADGDSAYPSMVEHWDEYWENTEDNLRDSGLVLQRVGQIVHIQRNHLLNKLLNTFKPDHMYRDLMK